MEEFGSMVKWDSKLCRNVDLVNGCGNLYMIVYLILTARDCSGINALKRFVCHNTLHLLTLVYEDCTCFNSIGL